MYVLFLYSMPRHRSENLSIEIDEICVCLRLFAFISFYLCPIGVCDVSNGCVLHNVRPIGVRRGG